MPGDPVRGNLKDGGNDVKLWVVRNEREKEKEWMIDETEDDICVCVYLCIPLITEGNTVVLPL